MSVPGKSVDAFGLFLQNDRKIFPKKGNFQFYGYWLSSVSVGEFCFLDFRQAYFFGFLFFFLTFIKSLQIVVQNRHKMSINSSFHLVWKQSQIILNDLDALFISCCLSLSICNQYESSLKKDLQCSSLIRNSNLLLLKDLLRFSVINFGWPQAATASIISHIHTFHIIKKIHLLLHKAYLKDCSQAAVPLTSE